MNAKKFARVVALAGLAVATTAATLLVPSAAQADVQTPPVGSQVGGLHLNPTSGAGTVTPGFSTTTPCPVGFQFTAGVDVVQNDGSKFGVVSAALPGTIINNPAGFSGTLGFPMGDIFSIIGVPGTYEMVVRCDASVTSSTYVQSTFVTWAADGSWTSSSTPPGAGPTNTTTSLAANFTNVPFGTSVSLTATVTPAGAAGNVQFLDGATVLATVALAGGTASTSTNTLQVGDHPITAHYVGNSSFNASTSSAVTVTITPAGTSGSETINVNVPLSEGVFTLTVSSTPVQLSDAVNNGTFFESTGTLSDVTVSDGRQQTKPGWSVSGQVSNFTSGTNSFPGSDLGWFPQVKTQNPAADVVAGPAVAAGATPGLAGGSGLASAGPGHGLFTSVLNAALDLRVPLSTAVGSYSALLTVTAVTHG